MRFRGQQAKHHAILVGSPPEQVKLPYVRVTPPDPNPWWEAIPPPSSSASDGAAIKPPKPLIWLGQLRPDEAVRQLLEQTVQNQQEEERLAQLAMCVADQMAPPGLLRQVQMRILYASQAIANKPTTVHRTLDIRLRQNNSQQVEIVACKDGPNYLGNLYYYEDSDSPNVTRPEVDLDVPIENRFYGTAHRKINLRLQDKSLFAYHHIPYPVDEAVKKTDKEAMRERWLTSIYTTAHLNWLQAWVTGWNHLVFTAEQAIKTLDGMSRLFHNAQIALKGTLTYPDLQYATRLLSRLDKKELRDWHIALQMWERGLKQADWNEKASLTMFLSKEQQRYSVIYRRFVYHKKFIQSAHKMQSAVASYQTQLQDFANYLYTGNIDKPQRPPDLSDMNPHLRVDPTLQLGLVNVRYQKDILPSPLICCIQCRGDHHTTACDQSLVIEPHRLYQQLRDMSSELKVHICTLCLNGHSQMDACDAPLCSECGGNHHDLLHSPHPYYYRADSSMITTCCFCPQEGHHSANCPYASALMIPEARWLAGRLHSIRTGQNFCGGCLIPGTFSNARVCECRGRRCTIINSDGIECRHPHHAFLHFEETQPIDPQTQIVLNIMAKEIVERHLKTDARRWQLNSICYNNEDPSVARLRIVLKEHLLALFANATYDATVRRQTTFCLVCWQAHDTLQCLLKHTQWNDVWKRLGETMKTAIERKPCAICFQLHSTAKCTLPRCTVPKDANIPCDARHHTLLHRWIRSKSPSTLHQL